MDRKLITRRGDATGEVVCGRPTSGDRGDGSRVRAMLGAGGASLLVVSAAGFVGVTVPTFPGLGKLEPLIHLYAAACWPVGVAMLVARGFLSAEVSRVKDLDPTPLARWVAAGLLAMAPLSHVGYDTCPHGYYVGVGRFNVVVHGERCGNTRHMKRLFVPW